MFSLRAVPLLLLSCFLCGPALAQQHPAPGRSEHPHSVVGQANFTVGVPTGSFRDNIEGVGYGANLFTAARFRDTPFMLGLDLGFVVYGHRTDTVPFSGTVGPQVMVDVVTTNSIVESHLVLRLQPSGGRVRPYLDGLFGLKYLVTGTMVRDEDRSGNQDDLLTSTRNFSDGAVSGGVGAGIDLRVYQGPPKKNLATLSVHLGVQYLVGGQAEYLAEGPLKDINGDGELDDEELDVRESTTTLIQPQFGLTLAF